MITPSQHVQVHRRRSSAAKRIEGSIGDLKLGGAQSINMISLVQKHTHTFTQQRPPKRQAHPNALCTLPTKATCAVAASIRTPCVPSHQRTHIAIAAAHPPPSTTKPRTHDDSAMQSITRNGCKRYSDRFSSASSHPCPPRSQRPMHSAYKSYMQCAS